MFIQHYLLQISESLSGNEESPLVGPFGVCLRWFHEQSPLRGCARRTASTAAKNPFRCALPHFQAGFETRHIRE
jgi:hypothetical protein